LVSVGSGIFNSLLLTQARRPSLGRRARTHCKKREP
jgi:hypothetical protein